MKCNSFSEYSHCFFSFNFGKSINNLNISLPTDYDVNNFKDISNTLEKLKNTTYTLNKIEKILKETKDARM